MTEEEAARINGEFAECILAELSNTLNELGVPRGTFRDEQFYNFISLYNNRGDILTAKNEEIVALEKQIATMEHMLLTIANWPNRENHTQLKAIKTWAGSVCDPAKVDSLKVLTKD